MSEEIKPVRIQRSRQHKQVSPNGLPIKYVGRPSCFGNWYEIGGVVNIEWKKLSDEEKKMFPNFTIQDADGAIYLFKKFQLPKLRLTSLKGKNLSCWCKLHDKCHADILLEAANKP